MQFNINLPLFVLLSLLVFSCKANQKNTIDFSVKALHPKDTIFVNLKDYSKDFVYDMKYATDDNFLKAKVYDCAECFLRLKTIKALILANKKIIKKAYRIKFFGC